MERAMTFIDTAAELVMTFPFRFKVKSRSLNTKVGALYAEIVVFYSTEMTVD